MLQPLLAGVIATLLAVHAQSGVGVTPQTATLSGVVRGSAGSPTAGAVVVIEHRGGRILTVTTDANGAFSAAEVTFPATVEVVVAGVGSARRVVNTSPVELVLAAPTVRETIVVNAASPVPSERPSLDPVTGAITLPSAFLEALPGVTLDETVRVVSGFSLFRRSTARNSNPTTHGVTMRGLSASGASRGLVLLDGIPLNDGFGGWVTWTRLPTAAVAEVGAQRGAQGDVFGTDALGGVIEMVPPTISRPVASMSLDAGTEGTYETEVAGGRRAGRAALFGAASWFATDGTIPVAPESAGPVDQPADADWFNGYGRATINWTGRRLVFAGWGGRDDRGNGTVVQRNRMSGGTFAASFDATSDAVNVAARVSVSPNSFYQTFSQVAPGRATETLTSTQFTDTTATRATVELGRRLAARGHLVGRMSLARGSANFRDDRPNPALSIDRDLIDDSEAISLQAGIAPAARLTIGGGVRHEWRKAPGEADERDTATVGRFIWALNLASGFDLRGAVSSSHRWPTLNEQVRNFQAGAILTLANPNLLPERGRSADVAATVSGDRWTVTTAGFWSVIDDAIANVTLTPNQRQRQNAGEAHATGVELDGEYRPWSSLLLRGSATIVDATFQNSIESAIEGKRIPQVPKVSFSWSMVARLPHALTASAVWRALSEQYDDDRNVFLLSEARQLDFRVAGRFQDFGWHVSLENALDRRIEVGRTPLVTVAPGRAVRAGVFWRR